MVFTMACLVGIAFTNSFWIILFLLAGWSFFLISRLTTLWMQNVAISLFAIFVCFTMAELFFLFQSSTDEEFSGTFTTTYYGEDLELGYGPNPGKYTVKKTFEGQLVYDQTYAISPERLRSIPEMDLGWSCAAAFFGGSVTFGEGVGDRETMPYFFVQASKGKFAGYNFGFHGYGPHHMLRMLEIDRFQQVVNRPLDIVIYQGIEAHVDRAIGKATWDLYGPSYKMEEHETLKFVGPFRGPLFNTMDTWLKGSALYLYIRNAIIRANSLSPSSVGLYVEILKKARNLVEETYGAKFVVLFWDKGSGNALAPLIMEKLRENQFHIIPISQIIPDIQSHPKKYVLSPHDPHPNALSHQIIGTYVANQFLDITCSPGHS